MRSFFAAGRIALHICCLTSVGCGGDDNPIVQAACTEIDAGHPGLSLPVCMEYTMPESSMDNMKEYCASPGLNGTWVDDGSCSQENIVGACDAVAGGQTVNKMKIYFYPDFTQESAEEICTTQYLGTWTPGS